MANALLDYCEPGGCHGSGHRRASTSSTMMVHGSIGRARRGGPTLCTVRLQRRLIRRAARSGPRSADYRMAPTTPSELRQVSPRQATLSVVTLVENSPPIPRARVQLRWLAARYPTPGACVGEVLVAGRQSSPEFVSLYHDRVPSLSGRPALRSPP